MAEHHFPLKENKKPIDLLSSFDLFNSAKTAEQIMSNHDGVVIPKIQWQSSKQHRNAWYVAFDFDHDIKVINLTITRPGVNVEFRHSQYLNPKYFDMMKWQTNSWRCIDTQSYSFKLINEVISDYLNNIRGDIRRKKIKAGGRSYMEDMIYNDLLTIYPSVHIDKNKRLDKMRSDKNKPLEFDIYVKDKSFAIEVQGPQHYKEIYGSNERLKTNDRVKIEWCKKNKINLIWINWEEYNQTILRENQTQRIIFFNKILEHINKSDNFFFDWPELISFKTH
ncbi:MAG: hypothetical protein LHW64_11435 [Candidatus Cloacimonetes bacterium]|nr:hypothetical protein [Candidatus Cloacimonadota bacterium]MDY0230701.1 hypothetical protein [Candidatus Cloacimonadaceae bacterium]